MMGVHDANVPTKWTFYRESFLRKAWLPRLHEVGQLLIINLRVHEVLNALFTLHHP